MTNFEDYLSRERGRQTQLARQLGLSAGTLSSIRNGQRRPSPGLAKRIEAATDGQVRAADLLGLEETGTAFDHTREVRALGDGRWSLQVAPDGSLIIPSEVTAALDLAPGENMLLKLESDAVRLHSTDKALQTLRAELRARIAPGRSLVDELIADRRAEAARE